MKLADYLIKTIVAVVLIITSLVLVPGTKPIFAQECTPGGNDCPGYPWRCTGACNNCYCDCARLNRWCSSNICETSGTDYGTCFCGGVSGCTPNPTSPPGGDGGGGSNCEGCGCGEGGNRHSCVPNPVCGGQQACCDTRAGCGGGGGGGNPEDECRRDFGPPPQGCCEVACRTSDECYWQETAGWWCDDRGWICRGNANSGTWSACSGSPATKTRVNECGTRQTATCVGSILARAVVVSRSDNSCNSVRQSNEGLIGTVHSFGPSSASRPPPQVQTSAAHVIFLLIPGGNYNLVPQPPADSPYVFSRACWRKNINPPLSGEGLFATLSVPSEGEVLTWDVGYSLPYPWWQVKDADVIANGNVSSLIPITCSLPFCNPQFELDGDGGYPGIPSYVGTYDFSYETGTGTVSSKRWIANSQTQLKKVYNYAFFESQIPLEVKPNIIEINSPVISGSSLASGGTSSRGYVWYHFGGNRMGDLTLEGDLGIAGGRKVILLVEGGDLHINGRINIVNRGQGFFMVVVGKTPNGSKGDIFVDPTAVAHPTLASLEGIFLAEGRFETGSLGQVLDTRLIVRGSVAAYNGVELQRDLTDNSSRPAEYFEFAPELMLLFPDAFTARKMRWKEEAP